MFDIDKWEEIFLTFAKNKLRTALTAFGIFWGIFLLVILMGAGNGLHNAVVNDFDIAKNAVFVWTQRTSVAYKGLKPGRLIQLENADLVAIRYHIPEARVVSPRLPLNGDFSVVRKDKSAAYSVFGDAPDFLQIKPLKITQGRFLNEYDLEDRRKIAVIGARVKELLFEEEEDPIGEYIKIKGVPFKVVGTFDSRSRGEEGIEDVQTIYIPYTTLQQAFNRPNRIGWFALLPQEGVPALQVEEKTRALLAQRHDVSPEDKRAIGSANIEQEFKEVQTLFTGIRGFSWLVAIGTIISGVVGVGNIMMITVRERTKEIGIRKSLGATPWSIIAMILKEALLLTGAAGYVGLMAGVGAVEGINYLMVNFSLESEFFENPQIDIQAALSAIVVLLIAGTLAGLIPGVKAVQVNPVIALRDE